jgi:predicted MFS family arabinose efflux permease
VKNVTLDRIILLLASAAFASSASMRVADAILPAVADTFTVEPLEAAHIISAATIAYSFFQLCFGPVGDRLGKFRTIAWATTVSTIGCALSTFADSIHALTLARILTGISAAAIIPLAMAWIGDQVPFAQRQPVLARFMAGQIMGLIGGQIIGGIMADTFGWRWAFAVLSLVYLGIGLLLLREQRINRDIDRLPDNRSLGFVQTVLLAVTRLLGIFKIRWAHVILWTVFCEGFITFSTLALLPTHLHLTFGTPLSHAGILLACFGLGGFIYIVSARCLVTHLGQPKMVRYGGFSIAVALLLLAPEWHWAMAGLSSALVGLGFYMLHNTLQTHATQMAPEVRGSAVSLFASAFFMGQSAGVSFGSQVLDLIGAGSLFTANAVAILLLTALFAGALRRKAATQA